jgi:peptidoglycan hydrolase CwlO-like protein
LSFQPGLNLIFGASNTGKSFAFKAIDYAMGASRALPDIEQRRPYDRLWLGFKSGGVAQTIARAIAGGGYQLYPGLVRSQSSDSPRVLAQRNDANDPDNISQYLLGQIGLAGKQVATNASGRKRPLSFRDIARFCMVDETSIQSEESPVLSGQHISGPTERSVFKLLLTGIDDSALVEVVDRKTFKTSQAAKIEFVTEMIEATEAELAADFPDADGLPDQEKRLDATFVQAQADADAAQGSIRGLLEDKRRIGNEFANMERRAAEIELNLGRFAQLHQVYQSDIERLDALEEAGFLLSLGGDRECPLCGASPAAQQHEHGLGDIERVRAAASVEITKIRQQQVDLTQTVQQLYAERVSLSDQLRTLADDLKATEDEIARLSPGAGEARRQLAEIMAVRDHVKRGISLIDQLASHRARLESLNTMRPTPKADRPTIGVTSTVAHEFSQSVSKVLRAWNFPGECHVSFDETTYDLKIDGKLRRDNGKGVRAITHAAIKVALLLFCKEKNLPHPGFLILDTPLLTYRDPITSRYGELEGDEEEISKTSLKDHFFRHLSAHTHFGQFIILENIDPPADIRETANLEVFYGRRGGGRAGLFSVG